MVAEVRAAGGQGFAIAGNISGKQQIHDLIDRTEAVSGPADVLVCNSAVNPFYGPMPQIAGDALRGSP